MDSRKLEEAIIGIVCKIFETSGKDLSKTNDITNIGKKCLEISLRQINFVVKEFFELTANGDKAKNYFNNDDVTGLEMMKKQLKRIDNTLDNYYESQIALENELNKKSGLNLPPSIIEKLMVKLESIQQYEPDFILNIRDISLGAWKETLDFEKILFSERKRFESFMVKLESKWRNRAEFIKYKTGIKINLLENNIEKALNEKKILRERTNMIIEDLSSLVSRYQTKENEFKAAMKNSGYKDLKSVIQGIKKMDNMRNRFQSQLETAQKEIKSLKNNLASSVKKQEDFKEKYEKSEENAKILEENALKIIELSDINSDDKKNLQTCITEKNQEKMTEIVKRIENSEKINKDDKGIERNNNVKRLTRNETEVKNMSPRKASNINIRKSNMQRISSRRMIEEPQAPNSSEIYITENKSVTSNTVSKVVENGKTARVMKKESNSSKVIIPTIKEEINDKVQEENQLSDFASVEKSKTNLSSGKGFLLQTPKIGNLPIKSNRAVQKHRKSLEPPLSEHFLLNTPKTQPLGSYANKKTNSLGDAISNIFSSHMLKNGKNPEFSSENLENIESINNMSIESLLNIKLKVSGQEKTIQDIILENIENSLKSEKSTVVWNSIIPEIKTLTKINEEIDQEPLPISLSMSSPTKINSIANLIKNNIEQPQQNWRNSTLKLFVLLEEYLDSIETNQYKTAEELIQNRINNGIIDEITKYITSSQDTEKEIAEVSELINRKKKYDLLIKICGIPKSLPFNDWKAEKNNIINKVRWTNLISKIKSNNIKKLQEGNDGSEMLYRLAIEIRNHRFTLKNILSNENLKSNKKKHNFSMENIAINELTKNHERNISLNHKGLHYFLPHIQRTTRNDKSFQMIPSSFLFSDLWVKNSKKVL